MAQYDGFCFKIGYYLYSKTLLGYWYHRRELRTAVQKYERGHSVCAPLKYGTLKIVPIALSLDNYSYLITDETDGSAVLVDPSDPAVVQAALDELEVRPSAILTTHKHWDHSGGNAELKRLYPHLRIYGNAEDNVPSMTDHLPNGGVIDVGRLHFTAMHTPGHTIGHAVYFLDGSAFGAPNSLFSGDLLFLGGAGRIFECSAEVMLHSLNTIAALDGSTLLWPGHEYALANLIFATKLDPSNGHLLAKLAWAKRMRHPDARKCTSPSTLAEELLYNPYLRTDDEAIVKAVTDAAHSDNEMASRLTSAGTCGGTTYRAVVLESLRRIKKDFKASAQQSL